MPHAPKAKKQAKRPKRKRRRKRKTARIITPGFGDFRRPRRFAHQPRRGPASVLHKHSAAFMLGALAQDMLTPMRPAPNWLTPRAALFAVPWRSTAATRAWWTPGSAPRCGARSRPSSGPPGRPPPSPVPRRPRARLEYDYTRDRYM